jgi:Zn-finger nucleic acid-binding protein
MELICPKCQGSMRTYERSGITVDQCSECRGIFLDRGELERLVDAETSFHTPAVAVPRPAAAPSGPAYGSPADDRYRDERYREGRPRDDDRYRDDKRDDKHRDDKHRDDRYRDSGDRYRSSDGYYDKRKKKRSFLEDLFD